MDYAVRRMGYEHGVWSMEYGVLGLEYRAWTMEYEVYLVLSGSSQ